MQCDSSITHRTHLECGWRVKRQAHFGQGDNAVSVVEYTNGSVWMFTNGSAEPREETLDQIVGMAERGEL